MALTILQVATSPSSLTQNVLVHYYFRSGGLEELKDAKGEYFLYSGKSTEHEYNCFIFENVTF
jgi:hypothetical protein